MASCICASCRTRARGVEMWLGISQDAKCRRRRLWRPCRRDRRSAIEVEWVAGVVSPQFGFVTGRHVGFCVGVLGGSFLLGICPTPASEASWRMMNILTVGAQGAPMEMPGACCSVLGNLSPHVKSPSASGDTNVFSSRSSASVRTDVQLPLAATRERFARFAPVKSGFA